MELVSKMPTLEFDTTIVETSSFAIAAFYFILFYFIPIYLILFCLILFYSILLYYKEVLDMVINYLQNVLQTLAS